MTDPTITAQITAAADAEDDFFTDGRILSFRTRHPTRPVPARPGAGRAIAIGFAVAVGFVAGVAATLAIIGGL